MTKKIGVGIIATFILLPWAIKNWSYVDCIRHYSSGVESEHPMAICNGAAYGYTD